MNDLLILALLLGGRKYGYQLKREAGWILGQDALHNNIVYPLLARFLAQGWVRRKSVPGERGQTRQQYVLTAKGKRTFFARAAEFGEAEAHSAREFQLRVGFFSVLRPALRDSILRTRERYLERRDGRLEELRMHLDLGRFGAEIVGYLRRQIAGEQEWIRHLRQIAARAPSRRTT
jgi:DNA-binding PadR family transcriptional regulator